MSNWRRIGIAHNKSYNEIREEAISSVIGVTMGDPMWNRAGSDS